MSSHQRRLTPDERRAVILRAAVKLTRDNGGSVLAWSRADVAQACEVQTSEDTVKHYFTQPDLRAAVEDVLTAE